MSEQQGYRIRRREGKKGPSWTVEVWEVAAGRYGLTRTFAARKHKDGREAERAALRWAKDEATKQRAGVAAAGRGRGVEAAAQAQALPAADRQGLDLVAAYQAAREAYAAATAASQQASRAESAARDAMQEARARLRVQVLLRINLPDLDVGALPAAKQSAARDYNELARALREERMAAASAAERSDPQLLGMGRTIGTQRCWSIIQSAGVAHGIAPELVAAITGADTRR